jgi:hypothetical protein
MTDRSVRELLFNTWRGRIGLGMLGLFVFLAIFGSAIAPDDPDASSLDILANPSTDHWRRSWARPSGCWAATSAVGPTASSTPSRTGSW